MLALTAHKNKAIYNAVKWPGCLQLYGIFGYQQERWNDATLCGKTKANKCAINYFLMKEHAYEGDTVAHSYIYGKQWSSIASRNQIHSVNICPKKLLSCCFSSYNEISWQCIQWWTTEFDARLDQLRGCSILCQLLVFLWSCDLLFSLSSNSRCCGTSKRLPGS